MINGEQPRIRTFAEFLAKVDSHKEDARRFFAQPPVECADLDTAFIASLLNERFPDITDVESPMGFIQIGYTLARRTDAGTLFEVKEEVDEDATAGEAGN